MNNSTKTDNKNKCFSQFSNRLSTNLVDKPCQDDKHKHADHGGMDGFETRDAILQSITRSAYRMVIGLTEKWLEEGLRADLKVSSYVLVN